MPVRAADWPAFYGARMDGVSTETNITDTVSQAGFPTLWKTTVGVGLSGVSVANGKLYTMGVTRGVTLDSNRFGTGVPYLDPKKSRLEITIYCLDALNGKLIWRHAYQVKSRFQVKDWRSKQNRELWVDFVGPKSVPTIDGQRVYTYDHSGALTCLDADNGKPVWTVPVREQLKGCPPRYGYAASPLVVDDRVVVPVFSDTVGLAAFNKHTGAPVWQGGMVFVPNDPDKRRWDGYSTPRVHQLTNKSKIILFYTGSGLYATDVSTGKTLWNFPLYHTTREVALSPVSIDDRVFIGSYYATFGLVLNIGGAQPRIVWKNDRMINHFSNVILWNGHLYGTSGYDQACFFNCVNFKTGVHHWTKSFRKEGRGPREQCQVIAADQKLMIMTGYGELVLARATPAAYQELGRMQVFETHGKAWCPMGFANGLLYCKDALGQIHCIDLRSDKSSVMPVRYSGPYLEGYVAPAIPDVKPYRPKGYLWYWILPCFALWLFANILFWKRPGFAAPGVYRRLVLAFLLIFGFPGTLLLFLFRRAK